MKGFSVMLMGLMAQMGFRNQVRNNDVPAFAQKSPHQTSTRIAGGNVSTYVHHRRRYLKVLKIAMALAKQGREYYPRYTNDLFKFPLQAKQNPLTATQRNARNVAKRRRKLAG